MKKTVTRKDQKLITSEVPPEQNQQNAQDPTLLKLIENQQETIDRLTNCLDTRLKESEQREIQMLEMEKQSEGREEDMLDMQVKLHELEQRTLENSKKILKIVSASATSGAAVPAWVSDVIADQYKEWIKKLVGDERYEAVAAWIMQGYDFVSGITMYLVSLDAKTAIALTTAALILNYTDLFWPTLQCGLGKIRSLFS